MLNPENIAYGVYVSLKGRQRDDLDFTIQYGGYELKDYLSETPLSERTFICVKELQQCVIDDNLEEFYSNILSLPEYSYDAIVAKPCNRVVITLQYLLKEAIKLIEFESTALTSKAPCKDDYSMYFHQIDFTQFPSYYSQLCSLANDDITKFDAIKRMKYSDCLVHLIYKQKQADVQTLITNSITSKK